MFLLAAQAGATALVLARLARGRDRRPALAVPPDASAGTVSVVIPARDEAGRIGPCIAPLAADPALLEVIVVDDGSTDATADVARRAGARVISAGPPPDGWVGKPWALQRGLETARGEFVVSLDADTRPRRGLAAALVAALGDADLVCAGARFICDGAGERWLHPALLATLVYRFGPPDARRPARPARLVVNGQCTAVRRRPMLDAGGYAHAAAHMTDDAAQARALARRGWRVAFHDGGGLIAVDMHASAAATWREWGRSIALRDVTSVGWTAADLAVVWLTLGLPPLRLLARRAGPLDLALLGLRATLAAALAPSYERRGAPYWLAPLADPAAALRLTISALRPSRRWRGRVYGPAAGTAPRSAS
jgi:dolichol-phosphate mannosyltransferase